MKFLRRMVEKSRATPPRLVARQRPLFAEVETRLEEREPDAVVAAPTGRSGAAPAAGSAPLRSERVASEPQPRGTPPETPPRNAEYDDERIVNAGVEASPDASVPRRPVASRAFGRPERPRVRPPAAEESERIDDDAPLVASSPASRHKPEPLAPQPAAPIVRERPPMLERTADRGPATTIVNVAIGRIDVRAAAAAPARPQRPEPVRPQLTLEAFLGRSDSR